LPLRAKDPSEFTCGGELVRKGAEGAFAEDSVEGGVRKGIRSASPRSKADTERESFGVGELVGSRDVLAAVVDTDDVAAESLCQEERTGSRAASDIEDATLGREPKQLTKPFGKP